MQTVKKQRTYFINYRHHRMVEMFHSLSGVDELYFNGVILMYAGCVSNHSTNCTEIVINESVTENLTKVC